MSGGPTSPQRRRRPRKRWIVAAFLAGFALLVATSPLTRHLVFHRTGKPVSIRSAVHKYRGGADTSRRRRTSQTPATGVYVYRTSGGESADLPIGTERHGYPALTAVIVRPTACGFSEQWLPLSGRGWYHELCRRDDALAARRLADLSTFFNVAVERDFDCQASPLVAPRAISTPPWRSTCRAGGFTDLTADASSAIVDHRPLSVRGRRVAAVHIRTTLALSGGWSGSAIRDTWRRRSDGLLLRLAYRERARISSHVGRIPYDDTYTLQLTTTTPRR
jgi:hypothetical protein